MSWFAQVGRRCPLVAALALVITTPALAQRASPWRSFKMADGLPESACLAVSLSLQGKVLVRHFNQPLVTELDGYSVHSFAAQASKSRVYQSPGGQFWVVSAEGVEEFNDGTWVLHPLPEVAAAMRGTPGQVIDPVPLFPVRQGEVILLLPDRLLEFTITAAGAQTRTLRLASQTGLQRFCGMSPARDGGLWISGQYGLAKVPHPIRILQPETEWREFLVPPELGVHNLQSPHEAVDGEIVALAVSNTNDQRLVVMFDGQDWKAWVPGTQKLRQAWPGPSQTHWAMSIDSLFEWDSTRQELVQNEDISPRQFFDLAVEPGGAFWLATSDGLYRYAPLLWRAPKGVRQINSLVRCLAATADNQVWFFAGNRFHRLQNGKLDDFALAGPQRALQPRAVYVLRDNVVVLAAQETETENGDQLFQVRPERGELGPVSKGRKVRALGLLRDGQLCLQALDSGGTTAWQTYDGRTFGPLSDPPPGSLLGTNLDLLFCTHNGDFWVSGELGTAVYHDKKWRTFVAPDKSVPAGVCSFTELPDGRLWCATPDEVWEFDGQNWAIVRRGFDRANQLLRTRDGSVWVASNAGLLRFFHGAWLENGLEEGLPSTAVRELYEDPSGQLWAATTRGLSQFHPEADPDPPQTTIDPLSDTGDTLPASSLLAVSFSGIDKWKYTPRERLLYSYRHDEQDWSPFQEMTHIPLTDLTAGKHVFQVRAMDRNGNIESKVQREFSIVLPWYKESRLVLIGSAGLITALFFAGLAFNRHRQLLHSYAEVERKVTERTQQLEVANRELVHSQKMNALGTLAAGIAHDFNNILSIIKGSAQIIEDNLDNPEKIRHRTDRIRMVVEQGAGIVHAMLGFSRESGQAAAACDVNQLVRDTFKLLGDRFLREVQVEFAPGPDLPSVVVSKDFIQQILLNFLFNAAESMNRNRRVLLRTRRLDKLPADLVLVPAGADCVAIAVQDFGVGITPENLPRIFEPFFTTKAFSARRGTGLGLSMVYELAKRMGAGLAVESAVDQGSTFTLLLPVSPAPNAPESGQAPKSSEPL